MTYKRESISQPYSDLEFLAHNVMGNIDNRSFSMVGDRVPSYGIINFGYLQGNAKKAFKPSDYGIEQDILLKSLWTFTRSATNEECTIRLFLDNQEYLEQRITNNEMPYTFPDGAILNPNLTLEVNPRYETMQLLVYWQPVHVLSYLEVNSNQSSTSLS